MLMIGELNVDGQPAALDLLVGQFAGHQTLKEIIVPGTWFERCQKTCPPTFQLKRN